MKENHDNDEIMMYKILCTLLSRECDDNMRVAFPEDLEKNTEKLEV